MPKLSGVKAARAIWRDFPTARIIFWTQFPHEIYINEIRKIVKSVDPPPAYGFIHKNNPESRFLRFVAAVLEDGADMIDPAFKDSFKRPLLTEFAEALYYLALGLSNWAIARKCSLSLRGVESRLATLRQKTLRLGSRGHRSGGVRKAGLQHSHPRVLQRCGAACLTATNSKKPRTISKPGCKRTRSVSTKNRSEKRRRRRPNDKNVELYMAAASPFASRFSASLGQTGNRRANRKRKLHLPHRHLRHRLHRHRLRACTNGARSRCFTDCPDRARNRANE